MKTQVKKNTKKNSNNFLSKLTPKQLKIAVIVATVLLLAILTTTVISCNYTQFNKVHTPYDNVSIGNYIKLSGYKTELKNADLDEMVKAEVNSFIRSEADELLIGDKTNNIPDRAIKKGDDVTISTTIKVYDENGELKDFDSLLDIEEGDTTTTANLKEYTIQDVGNGDFLPEIENALLNDVWTGDIEYVDVQYDDKVQTEELKNKKVQIEIKVHKIVEVVLPEYGDAFIAAKTVYKTVAEFEENLRKELVRAYVWSLYIDRCTVRKYPADKITKYQDEFKNYYELTAQEKGMTLEKYVVSLGSTMAKFNEEMQSYAQGTVKEEMILYFIAEKENLSFTEEEYQTEAKKMAEDYGCKDVAELESIYTRTLVERNIYWEMVKDFLYSNVKYA